jgi:hypothetical protein
MRTNEDHVLLPVATGPPYAGPRTLKKGTEIIMSPSYPTQGASKLTLA